MFIYPSAGASFQLVPTPITILHTQQQSFNNTFDTLSILYK